MSEIMPEKASASDLAKEHQLPADSENSGVALQNPKESTDRILLDIPDVRSRIQTEFDSNRGYQMMADRIITVSKKTPGESAA